MGLIAWHPLINNFENKGVASSIPTIVSGNSWESSGKIGAGSLKITKLQTIFPSTSVMSGVKEMSYCYWIKVNTAWSQNWRDGIRWYSTDGSSPYISRQEFYNNCTTIGTWYKSNSTGSISGKSFTPGIWTHLAGTYNYNTGEVKFYIDGICVGITTDLDTTHYCRGDFYIGEDGVDINMNDLRIYNHCLSAAEVREISQGLVLHYKLDQTIGYIDVVQNPTTYVVYNNYSGSGTTGTLTNLSETFHGSVVRREVMTPNDTSVSNFRSSLGSHGIYGFRQTFLANTKYVFWIYYRPISHTDVRVGGNASNIGGWTEIPPVAVGNGWYRVGQYRNGTVTSDKTDNIFTSFYTATAASGVPITIDWASPHLLQGTTEIPADDSFIGNNLIIDSSGYGYNGTILGNPISNSDTARYSTAIKFPTNTDGIESTFPLALWNNAFTYSFWIKPSGENGGRSIYAASYNGTSCSIEKTTGNKLRFYWNGSPDLYTSNLTITDGSWQHIVVVKSEDKTKVYCYYNGELKDTLTNTLSDKSFTGTLKIGRDTRTDATSYIGLMSDFRIYATALSAADVKSLYEVGARVDNKQGWHTYEFIDNSKETVTKTGKTLGHNIIETYLPLYDKTIYTEPDGSKWIHIFHHNNPAGSKFDSPTTDWLLGKYIDTNRWYDVDQAIYNSLSPYEFMVKQKTTSSAAETKYRWRQTANPLTAAWADVKPGTPTFITTTGYSSSSMGGLYIFKNSNLHMCIANGSNGNWYGGIGCAAAFNGGIPGYPNTTVTDGYVDLYMRVYANAKVIKNIGINAANLIEF